ncbi:MAG: hypoxanthine phosphoribosyltransferase [Oscillospiraceae bacterium]|jgi:hypoxanthine phosphoribosyltransferase|nr:hypoxanthine phosphoribosyltransferase [Oscillospiraceae bacterium]
MHPDILNISYSEDTISRRVAELGAALSGDYAGKNPVFLGILKGSFVFMADLIRACAFPLDVQFLRASSYGAAAVSSGVVDVQLNADVRGRHVVIVEDILDTGITLKRIRELLAEQDPLSVKICAFLDKPARRETDVLCDYTGFTCEPDFFVGYGLDYNERYRNLPYIGVLKPEIYSN